MQSQNEWFSDTEFKFILQKNNLKNTDHSLYRSLCSKDINIEHQGRADITRHINGNAHKKSQEPKRKQPGIDSVFLKASNHSSNPPFCLKGGNELSQNWPKGGWDSFFFF